MTRHDGDTTRHMTRHDDQLPLSYDAQPPQGLGNGGVTPPLYERRKEGTFDLEGASDVIRAQIGHQFRRFWIDDLTEHLKRGEINLTDFAIGCALSDFSDNGAKIVFPSQATIGKQVGRSASTVNRSLARLRRYGLLEWAHRFLQSRDGKPRATTNLYAFRLSDRWMEEDFEKRRNASNKSKGRRHNPIGNKRTTPKKRQLDPSVEPMVAGIAQTAPTWEDAVEEVSGLSAIDNPVEQLKLAWHFYRRE